MQPADIEETQPLETGASVRPKRERSAAQMEAFERARQKRAALCEERRAQREHEKNERKAQKALEKQRRNVCDEMSRIPNEYYDPDPEQPHEASLPVDPRAPLVEIDMDELCSNLAARLNKIYAPVQTPPPPPRRQQPPKPQAPHIRFVYSNDIHRAASLKSYTARSRARGVAQATRAGQLGGGHGVW